MRHYMYFIIVSHNNIFCLFLIFIIINYTRSIIDVQFMYTHNTIAERLHCNYIKLTVF